jgi:hypothetical protein
MPKGIIKTPAQEKKWKDAKASAAKQGQSGNWAYVMGVFKQMGGMSKVDGEDKNVLIERALSAQGKKTAIPHEAHQVLHSWWRENKDKLVSPKQKQNISDVRASKEPRASMKLVKNKKYLDEMYAGLSAIRNQVAEDLNKADDKKRVSKFADWQQQPDHSPEELSQIQKLVDDGYHPREAAHLISNTGVGRGEYRSFDKAKHSTVRPTMLSDKVLSELKDIARQRLEQYEAHAGKGAQPEQQPVKYAAHQMKMTHGEKTANYHKAYTDFLASDDLKGLSPLERHKKIQSWKSEWKNSNPDYEKSLVDVANIGSKYKEAEEARKQHVEEIKHHLVHGGAPIESATGEDDVETSAPMSARAISEHMGLGGEDEDEGQKISAQRDPSTRFSSSHRRFVESVLKPEVDKPKTPATQTPTPKPEASTAPQPAAPAPKTIIRRMAKPDQLDRLKGTDAAKMALQTKKAP